MEVYTMLAGHPWSLQAPRECPLERGGIVSPESISQPARIPRTLLQFAGENTFASLLLQGQRELALMFPS